MNLDVFNSDAFGLTELTTAINLIPYQPTRIQTLGWFRAEPIATTQVMIEMEQDVLSLVPVAPRGGVGTPKTMGRRNARPFSTAHLPQTVQLMADEVQNLRAFGKQTETELAMARLNRKMAIARRDLDLTIEFQRMGAIKGNVLDADGSTVLLNLFTEFGVSQQTLDMALSNSATKVLQKCITFKRMTEDKLGGVNYASVRVLCSPEFFDAFTGHAAVEEAFRRWQESSFMRADSRKGFPFADVVWEEYRGQVGATRFIESGAAYAVPEGVPDLFITHYAPAPYMETVNTEGLPYYAKQEMMPFNKGINCETQSNPLHLCTRPNAVVKLTA